MDDRSLVGVLHRVANLKEQCEALTGREPVPIAVFRDGNSQDLLHDEKRAPLVRLAGIEDLRDAGVVHQRQRLPLGVEAGDHLSRVHPRLDELERDATPHGR